MTMAKEMEASLTESMTLLNATVGFLDTHLALIHIPRELYSFFIQPILQLLLHCNTDTQSDYFGQPQKPWAYWHPFVNVSITSGECSIVCPRQQAQDLFEPIIANLDAGHRAQVSISKDDYSVIMIGGEGLEAGQRVLDLTSPLAMAGIPIFFITSYWSDFVLVPLHARAKVIRALEDRGFEFEAAPDGEGGHMTNVASPIQHPPNHRHSSSSSSFDVPTTPGTPPPASVSELQIRTFKLLQRRDVKPFADRNIDLVTCAGIKDSTVTSSANKFTNGKIQLGLVSCLTSIPPPQFLSFTLTDTESPSLTLERRLLALFPNGGEDVLLGKEGDVQVAITLDLRELPLESTGIVCGVASRVIDGMKRRIGRELFNMSYLSTAKAGHVIVYEDELDDALETLKRKDMNGSIS